MYIQRNRVGKSHQPIKSQTLCHKWQDDQLMYSYLIWVGTCIPIKQNTIGIILFDQSATKLGHNHSSLLICKGRHNKPIKMSSETHL